MSDSHEWLYKSLCRQDEKMRVEENWSQEDIQETNRLYAHWYARRGSFKIVDYLFERWLQDDPSWGEGWTAWAESHCLPSPLKKTDIEKAIHILERGLSVKGVKSVNRMKGRLKGLKKAMINPPWLANEDSSLSSSA